MNKLFEVIPKFKERKAVELAYKFLTLNDGKMNYLKLLRLMYLAERESLKLYDRPITFDIFVLNYYGVVGSHCMSLVRTGGQIWSVYLSPRTNAKKVNIYSSAMQYEKLCKAEMTLIESVFATTRHMNSLTVLQVQQSLAEYKACFVSGAVTLIDYATIFKSLEKSEMHIQRISTSFEELSALEKLK